MSTGIEVLDRVLKGGIDDGSSLLISGTPGIEDLPIAHQVMYTQLKNNCNAIYLVNNKKPDNVKELMRKYDWNVEEFKKSCRFIDSYSGLMAMGSGSDTIDDPTNISKVKEKIITCLNKLEKNSIVVIDSLSSMIDITDSEEEVVKFTEEIHKITKKKKSILIALFTEWPYEESTTKRIQETFDCMIRLKAIERKVITRSYFSVEKANWLKEFKRKDIPFKVMSPGGVKVFIPKILVTGPFNAGKTSFIHSASVKATSVDRLGTTVALDHGHVECGGFTVDLFGTPGQKRFNPLMESLGSEALGVIVIVDSSNPKGFERAKEQWEFTKTKNIPTVIVANKTNLEGALSPDEIRKTMEIPENIPIIPTKAEHLGEVKENEPCKINSNDVKDVLDTLFDQIIHS